MADEKENEGVYGENIDPSQGHEDKGIREETVEAHPQPTGDAASDPDGADTADTTSSADVAADVKARGAEAIEGSEGSVEEDLDAVRRGAAQDAEGGGMGREETPRNPDDASQGEFGDHDADANEPVPG